MRAAALCCLPTALITRASRYVGSAEGWEDEEGSARKAALPRGKGSSAQPEPGSSTLCLSAEEVIYKLPRLTESCSKASNLESSTAWLLVLPPPSGSTVASIRTRRNQQVLVPGCLSSVPQAAINNCRLRSLVLHRTENESHLEACSALSMPFSQQNTKAHRPATYHLLYAIRGPGTKGRTQPLLSKTEKETSWPAPLSALCVCTQMLWSHSAATVLNELPEQLLPEPSSLLSFISRAPN